MVHQSQVVGSVEVVGGGEAVEQIHGVDDVVVVFLGFLDYHFYGGGCESGSDCKGIPFV